MQMARSGAQAFLLIAKPLAQVVHHGFELLALLLRTRVLQLERLRLVRVLRHGEETFCVDSFANFNSFVKNSIPNEVRELRKVLDSINTDTQYYYQLSGTGTDVESDDQLQELLEFMAEADDYRSSGDDSGISGADDDDASTLAVAAAAHDAAPLERAACSSARNSSASAACAAARLFS